MARDARVDQLVKSQNALANVCVDIRAEVERIGTLRAPLETMMRRQDRLHTLLRAMDEKIKADGQPLSWLLLCILPAFVLGRASKAVF